MDPNPYQTPELVTETARRTQQFLAQRLLFGLLGCVIVIFAGLATTLAAYNGGGRYPELFGIFGGLALLGASLIVHGIVRTDRSLKFILGSMALLFVYVAVTTGLI